MESNYFFFLSLKNCRPPWRRSWKPFEPSPPSTRTPWLSSTSTSLSWSRCASWFICFDLFVYVSARAPIDRSRRGLRNALVGLEQYWLDRKAETHKRNGGLWFTMSYSIRIIVILDADKRMFAPRSQWNWRLDRAGAVASLPVFLWWRVYMYECVVKVLSNLVIKCFTSGDFVGTGY